MKIIAILTAPFRAGLEFVNARPSGTQVRRFTERVRCQDGVLLAGGAAVHTFDASTVDSAVNETLGLVAGLTRTKCAEVSNLSYKAALAHRLEAEAQILREIQVIDEVSVPQEVVRTTIVTAPVPAI